MSDLSYFSALLDFINAIKGHMGLQAQLRDAEFSLENALENRDNIETVNEKVDKIESLIADIERAGQAVHSTFDGAQYALEHGLALTVQSGCTRMATNWLDGKKAEIQRRYSPQEARE